MRKRSIIIVLTFLFLTYLELGILREEFWLAWRGMEYTEAGESWGFLLDLSIPVIAIIMFLNDMIRCIKARNGRAIKNFFLDCFCALLGIGIGIGTHLTSYDIRLFSLFGFDYVNPVKWLGAKIADFLIEYFEWMDWPML